MEFIKFDFGQLEKGRIVEIILRGNAANVQLLDNINFNNYTNGRQYRYIGGLATRSPVRLTTPYSGHWYAAVDMRGLRGAVSVSAKVLPQQPTKINQETPSEVPSPVTNQNVKTDYKYDVFISHASEDKKDIVRPLALALKSKGVKVWYDEFELKIGDSLREKIDRGLTNSRFGIVVISRNFIKKKWTNYELNGIITKKISEERIVLPIWHNITRQEVEDYSPSLADILALNTANNAIEDIANEITDLILNR